MSKNYNRKDHLYKKAKQSGYRSRAAYKLLELNNKHKLFRRGSRILDLGCFPGGWIQVAAEFAGPGGLILGIDLTELEPIKTSNPLTDLPKIDIFIGDLKEEDTKNRIRTEYPGAFDTILSDMSPKLTGIKDRDQVATTELFQLALDYCSDFLKPGGNFVCKVFPGNETEDTFKEARKNFRTISRTNLDSSRASSNEIYVIGKGFQGNTFKNE
ncbi:MAG TPA: RlmE family RNA methyltransferase [Oligoflexia bacterium]|nr:RlmE family RNA methyltransferase [Oligoflexia bacterium]HMP49250.1 RlmE family RNA methyltransferase [Oligoflexia bacterium]